MNSKLTKLIVSIGPATEKIANLQKIIDAGAEVARLNFSHGSAVDHLAKMEYIKSLRFNNGECISLLLDTKGPEIRTHSFVGGQATVQSKTEVRIYLKEEIEGNDSKFSITYPNLNKDVKVGDTIMIDDGYLELEVIKVDEKFITTISKNTHTISDRRGVNIPGGVISIDFLSEKDQNDIKFAAAADFDYIALSFVQSKEDILQVRKLLKEVNKEDIQLIAKLESHGAVENFEEILHEADGIMVARGDLGIEIAPELVPTLQKKWIREANKLGKPVIVATQMLESMTYNPRPTRAEVSDVYNAVEDAASAIMLSGESAKGQYWLESVEYMSKISMASERHFDGARFYNRMLRDGAFSQYADQAKEMFKNTFISPIEHVFVLEPKKEQIKAFSRMRPNAKIIPVYTNKDKITSWGINYAVYPMYSPNEVSFADETALIKLLKTHVDYKKGLQVIVIQKDQIKDYTL